MERLEVWAGLRPLTPDGLSLLGRSPRYDNLTLAAGHSMIGMSSGPASARLVTQVITGEEPFMDHVADGPCPLRLAMRAWAAFDPIQ